MHPPRSIGELGFTLLELLVVVAVLAIVGGSLLVAYDDVDDMASEGVAAHTLASLDSAIRNYTVVNRSAPNYLDALIAADYAADADPAVPLENPEYVKIMHKHLDHLSVSSNKGRMFTDDTMAIAAGVTGLTQAHIDALEAAGITHLRYVDAEGNDETPGPINAPDANGDAVAEINNVYDIDIPHRIHESARPGNPRRGRGFAHRLAVGDQVLIWNANRGDAGTGGYDNTKIGAGPDDVVVIFGLGNDATCVGATGGRTQLASAPVYGKRENRWEYGRYYLLYNLGPHDAPFDKARLQIVLNSHGDFVDEMIAEHGLQKP